MAQQQWFLLFSTFSLVSFLLFHSVLCRMSFSETNSHTVLDVSASVQKTLDVLSFDPQTQIPLQQQEVLAPSSSFSLDLHPRDSIHNSQHKDYRDLVLSRLERDSARINSLNTKLDLALNGIRKSDLKPVEAELQPEDLSTPVTSGVSQGSGEYFTRIGVGSPPQVSYMVLDTGSDINWLQCKPCSDCYQQADPIFDPSKSSTFAPLGCDSPACKSLDISSCRNGTCLYQVSYGDGSFTVGDLVSDTFSFGSSGSVPKVSTGCGHDNEGLFVGAAGLLGLGAGSLSLPSQIKASSVSYCLVDRDSATSSTLEFNSPRPSDSITTALLKNGKMSTFYYVGVTGLSVGGHSLSIPPSLFQVDASGRGGIIVDSGTAVTRLQSQAYESLRDAFVKMTDLPSTSGVSLFDTCYDLSSKETVKVPTVSFQLEGGKSLSLRAQNYMIPVDSAGTFCFAFAPTTGSLSIIGNVQQQGTRVSFDLANSVVGFSTVIFLVVCSFTIGASSKSFGCVSFYGGSSSGEVHVVHEIWSTTSSQSSDTSFGQLSVDWQC